jgi:hypothetical protein
MLTVFSSRPLPMGALWPFILLSASSLQQFSKVVATILSGNLRRRPVI